MGVIRRLTAIVANLSLLLNSFLPFLLIAKPTYAQSPEIVVSKIVYDTSANKLDITTNSTEKIAYQLFYKTPEKIDAIAGNDLNQSNQNDSFYLGTCSANSACLSQKISRGILKIESNSKFYSKLFIFENDTLTVVKEIESSYSDLTEEEDNFLENGDFANPTLWTFEKVELNKEYVAPQNSGVKITFTKLPETSGNIKIEEITLTPEQIEQTGSLSDKAYDITSDMVDGTFAYNLSLPIPESSINETVEIKYAEDISEIELAQKVDNTTTNTNTSVSVNNLDHFTIFVITGSVGTTTYDQNATSGSWYLRYVGTPAPAGYSHDYQWKNPQYSCDPNNSAVNFIGKVDVGSMPVGSVSLVGLIDKGLLEAGKTGYQSGAYVYIYKKSSNLVRIGPSDGNQGGEIVSQFKDYSVTSTLGIFNLSMTIYNGNISIVVDDDSTMTDSYGVKKGTYSYSWNEFEHGAVPGWDDYGLANMPYDFNVTGCNEIKSIPICNNASSFDNLSLGSVNGQGGWMSTGPYDQEIVSNSYGFDSFGCKTLRLSNGVASGSFGDQTFSFSNANEAGETLATNGGQSGGIRQNHYEAQFDFTSTQLTQQPGLSISVSPDRGDGSRMSYLRFVDNTNGIDVFFDDVSGITSPVNFNEIKIADNLSRTTTHSAKFIIDFIEGPSNDVVKIYIDGSLVYTGTTWENYYRFDNEASAEQSPRTTDNLLFRASGGSVPANNGKGFLFDNITLSSSTIDTSAPQINNLKYYKNSSLITTPSTSPIFIKSIDDLTYGADYQDNSGLNRTAFVIWDATDTWNPISNSHKCNWNGSPSTTILNSTTTQTLSEVPLKQCNPSYSWPSGKYIIAHIVYDNAGNSSYSTGGSQRFIIDNTVPSKPSFISPTINITNINAITLKWDGGDDTGSGVKGYIFRYVFNPANGGSPVNWSSGFVNTTAKTRSGSFGHGQGTYMMFVKIIDNAGNESLESDALNITYDSIAPIITVNSYITNDKTPKITGTVDDNSATILVEVNGFNYVATNNGNGTWTLADNVITPNLIDNTYDVIATATDTAGNIGIDLTTDELIIDSVAPNATFQHYIDGVLFTGPIAYTNSLNKLTFTAEYTDTNPSSQLLKDSYVIFDAQSDHSFKFSQNGAKAYCGWRSNPNLVDLSGNPFSLTIQEPFTNCINSLNEGEYYLAHQVYDNAIRQDIPSITQFRDVLGLHFIIDKTAPTSTIDGGGDNETIYSSSWDGSLSGTATDNLSGVAGVQVSIKNESDKYYDGSGFNEDSEKLLDTVYTDSSGTWEYSGLTDPTEDSYTVKSHAIDKAGNIEDTYTLTIVLDKTISEVGISLNPKDPDAANGWYKTQPEITLTHTDTNFDKIEYQWDSQSNTGWNIYLNPFKLANEGAHILYYRAVDKANNISPVGIKNIKWDKTDLELGPQNISASPNPTSGSTSKITWEAAKDNDGIDKYEVHWTLNDSSESKSYSKTVGSNTFEVEIDQLIEGRWTVRVIAFDASGKSRDNSIDLIVDRTGPSAPVLSLTGTGTGTASLSWNTINDAKDYIIWYGNTPGTYLYGARVGNVTSYTVQGLGAGNYYFVIKSVDEAQNQSGYSNEVNTGNITGAIGTIPGQPAEGFAEDVLGDDTENDTTNPTPTLSSGGEVLGESGDNLFNWRWLLLLLLVPTYFIGRRFYKEE